MDRLTLHGTELTVSRLCMGTANFGETITEAQAFEQMDLYCMQGGNFLDTAHVYGDWLPGERSRSERIIGRWLQGVNRRDVIVCTKGGHFDLQAPHVSRVTPEEIRRDLAESLDALQVDTIDLYMLHRDNPALPVGEIVDCLDAFVRSGAVRYIACSNWTAERTRQANEYAARNGRAPFVVNELMWSMAEINRDGIPADYVTMDAEMHRYGQQSGISFMCYSALAHGYLTKRYAGKPVAEEWRRAYDNPHNEALVKELAHLPDADAVTRESLRFFARQDVTAIPIVAFTKKEQLLSCLQGL